MSNSAVFKGNYTFEEFCTHFNELYKGEYFGRDRTKDDINNKPGFEESMIEVMEFMGERFKDEQEFIFKSSRFMHIMRYLSQHICNFDHSDYAVYGSEEVGALASNHLLKAIHFIITSTDYNSDFKYPTPKEVMALADSYRNS